MTRTMNKRRNMERISIAKGDASYDDREWKAIEADGGGRGDKAGRDTDAWQARLIQKEKSCPWTLCGQTSLTETRSSKCPWT